MKKCIITVAIMGRPQKLRRINDEIRRQVCLRNYAGSLLSKKAQKLPA